MRKIPEAGVRTSGIADGKAPLTREPFVTAKDGSRFTEARTNGNVILIPL
jgi:hypothetical protein